jgi:hypothetical protein
LCAIAGWIKTLEGGSELGYGNDRGEGMIGDEDGMLQKNRKCGGKGPLIDSEVYISAQQFFSPNISVL